MNSSLKLHIDLYITFAKIAVVTIGGGNAMIPLVQHEFVDKKKCLTDEDLADYITLAQSAPGITGINTSTAVGRHVSGLTGSIASTLGIITPSLLIILVVATFIDNLQQLVLVHQAFQGVRAAVIALIFLAVTRLYKNSVKDKFQFILMTCSTVLVVFTSLPASYIIVSAGFIGVMYNVICERRKKWK